MSLKLPDICSALQSTDVRVVSIMCEQLLKAVSAEGFNRIIIQPGQSDT